MLIKEIKESYQRELDRCMDMLKLSSIWFDKDKRRFAIKAWLHPKNPDGLFSVIIRKSKDSKKV